jgi:hypothetical protein
MLEISETAFTAAIKDSLEAGKEIERERIINLLNQDAVLQMNLSAQWLTYIVEMIESV